MTRDGAAEPRTALASFPRSGNTWLRRLIEAASGRRSGSVYDDRVMPRGPEGIVVKTHRLDREAWDRAIHLVRNPFDAIESYFHWKRDVLGDAGVSWEAHVAESAGQWRRHTEHWLAATCPVHRVRYEDLHADPAGVLVEVLGWLGESAEAGRCARAVRAGSLEGMREAEALGPRFFRRGEVGRGIASFSQAQRDCVVAALQAIGPQLAYP